MLNQATEQASLKPELESTPISEETYIAPEKRYKNIPHGRQQSYFASIASGGRSIERPVNYKKWRVLFCVVVLLSFAGLASIFFISG